MSGWRMPRGLLGAGVLLWGGQNGLLAPALAVAVALEGAPLVSWRLRLDHRDYHRLGDLCYLALIAVALFHFDRAGFRGIYGILAWLPLVCLPLILGQLYGSRERVRLSAVFLSVRRAEARVGAGLAGDVDFRFVFLGVCLVSATAGHGAGSWFLPGLGALCAWLLAANRPERYRIASFTAMLALALLLGWGASHGVIEARRVVEPVVLDWFREQVHARRDPYRSHTSIGQIGRIKGSDRIVLRVDTGGPVPPPLLRERSFRTFSRNLWLASGTDFEPVAPDAEGTAWRLDDDIREGRSLLVSAWLQGRHTLLPAPSGTHRLERLPVEGLEVNGLAVLRAGPGPNLVEYRAVYAPGRSRDLPPGGMDLAVPRGLESLLGGLVAELGLSEGTPEEAVRRIRGYFVDGFRYSIEPSPGLRGDAVAAFLEETRTGHCEHFATATVLLLRAAGFPARYATGFAAMEWSDLEGQWIARRRHAHAWALVWSDGRWQDHDTTPPGWVEEEAGEAGWWEPIYNLGSWAYLGYGRWRWGFDEADEGGSLLAWLLLPLGIILIWRLLGRERVRPAAVPSGSSREPEGGDSPLYRVEERLRRSGLVRPIGVPMGTWLAGLAASGELPAAAELTPRAVALHYRYRFDPGLEGAVALHRELREEVDRWLARHSASLARSGVGTA
jgi:protein-glutamine gamma-glutamyltransferase